MTRWRILLTSLLGTMIAWPSFASVYGALYEVGNLTAQTGNGTNTEAVLMYHGGTDGFVAITTNTEHESEWWTSNTLGTSWVRSNPTPLDAYDCTQPGRHAIHTYQNEVYFGVECGEQGLIFKLTGVETVELMHTRTTADAADSYGYPTAATVNGNLYFFYNGGFTEFDGTTWTDVTDATGQNSAAPLEASREVDGVIYLAYTSGEVMTFDGSEYVVIGEDYLEHIAGGIHNNLPSIEYFNDTVYVGNQDFDNGATLFKYDEADGDGETWEVAENLDTDNTIINKMLLSRSFADDRYLVYFTSNHVEGVNIFARDESDTSTELIDAGLGGTNPENNSEVISAIRRDLSDGGVRRAVMMFSTQNTIDQAKVFILVMGPDLAFTPFADSTISASSSYTTAGEAYTVRVPKRKVKAGDVYTLWVDGKVVDRVKARTSRPLTLRFSGARKLEVDDTFTVQIGRRLAYGRGKAQLLSRNTVKGEEVTVTVE